MENRFGAFGVYADPPGKPPLLLVHGFLSSRNHWLPNQKALREHFRLVIVDLPGHGLAPACADPDKLRFADLVTTLDDLRRALGIDRWCICGQSFGATLTLRYALAYPDRVFAQVWTNSNSAIREPFDEAGRASHAERIAALRYDRKAALRRQSMHPRFARRFPEEMRDILSADADGCDIDTLIAILEHSMPVSSIRDRLGLTQVPTLLVSGAFERSFQPRRNWAEVALPAMLVKDLNGGHAINIEQPAEFNAAVMSFLRDWVK